MKNDNKNTAEIKDAVEKDATVKTPDVQESEPSEKSQFVPGKADKNRHVSYDIWKKRAFQAWAIVGAGLIIAGILYIAGIIWQALAVVIIAVLITFLLHGLVDWLEKKGLPRIAGTCISLAVVLVVLAAVILSFVPTIVSETQKFIASVPDYAAVVQDSASKISSSDLFGLDEGQINSILSTISSWVTEQGTAFISNMAGGLIGGVIDFGTGVMLVFIAFICAFWMLLDLPKIMVEIRKLVPDDFQDDFDVLSTAFGTAIYGWAKATLSCAVLTGIFTFAVLQFMGVPYAALLGLLAGLLYFIPYIGPTVATIVVALIALIVSPMVCVLSIIACGVINTIVGNFISPKLMKNSVNVHPAIVLVVLLIGGALGGVWGMLASIPIAAAIQGAFVTYYEANTGKKLATPDGALFHEAEDTTSRLDKLRNRLRRKHNENSTKNFPKQ